MAGELCQETLSIPKNAKKEPPLQKPSTRIYNRSHSAIPSFSRSLFALTAGNVETIHFYMEHRRLRPHSVARISRSSWNGRKCWKKRPGMMNPAHEGFVCACRCRRIRYIHEVKCAKVVEQNMIHCPLLSG